MVSKREFKPEPTEVSNGRRYPYNSYCQQFDSRCLRAGLEIRCAQKEDSECPTEGAKAETTVNLCTS